MLKPSPSQLTSVAKLLLLSMVPSAAVAQQILSPPPSEYLPTARTTPGGEWGEPGVDQSATTKALSAGEQALTWGMAHLKPRLMYRLSYGDGVPSQTGRGEKTFINEIIPGISLDIGEQWNIDYAPVIRLYSSDQYQDGVNQYVSLRGGTTYEDWIFGFRYGFSQTSDPLIQTGLQTDQTDHLVALSGKYQINTDVSLELGLNQDLRFTELYNDSLEWSTLDWLNYQVAPALGMGFGLGGGYVDVSNSTDMTFEQVQGRIMFRAGDKLSFLFSGGVDIRQFLDSELSGPINPIFGLTARYQIFEPTTVSLNGSRTVDSSYYTGQITENSSIGANLRQRLMGQLYLDLGGGYRITRYTASEVGIPAYGDQDGFFAHARLSTSFLERGTIGIFYSFSENTSNPSAPAFSSNLVGLEVGYHF